MLAVGQSGKRERDVSPQFETREDPFGLVSKMLGHSSITLTADTYSHLLAGVGRKAADAVDALIVRKPREQLVPNLVADTDGGPTDEDGEGL